jgi:Domain of unknown function (DUF4337)
LEIEAEKTADRKLNSLVAITVLLVSVFLSISKLKDDNLVRKMDFVKADSVDIWNEYQAERLKLHGDENASQAVMILPAKNGQAADAEKGRLEKQIAKYTAQSNVLANRARNADALYKVLEFRHDQFDMEDSILSITLALTAVAALTETYWLLIVGWVFAGLGFIMGLSGFLEWSVHPEFLARLLG